MSSSTSTPAALSSDARALAGICWRLVEAQYHVSTLKLVDSVAEQELIEHSSHGDGHAPAKISQDSFREGEEEPSESEYGEADEEHLRD